MQDSIRTVQLIMDSANSGSGRTLDATQVVNLARYIMTYEGASNDLYEKLMDTESMLGAYVNEYGRELIDELLKDVIVNAEIVEGEIEEETPRRDDENVGLDPQAEEEE
jgi:hypothetical protein